MRRFKKYYLLILPIILFLFINSTTSCNPYRRGATVRQGGAPRQMKYHSRPASAKRPRKNKY